MKKGEAMKKKIEVKCDTCDYVMLRVIKGKVNTCVDCKNERMKEYYHKNKKLKNK